MKNINRNIYLLVIVITEVLFFTYAMVLYKRGTIDTHDLQTGGIFAGGIGVLAIALAFSKKTWLTKKKDGDFDPNLLEVSHIREGLIFEVLTGLILVGSWIVALASDRFWIIENFFSFLDPSLMFMLTIITIIFLWIVYLPPFKTAMRQCTTMEQVALNVRMCRVLAVEFALFVLLTALPLEFFSVVFSNILMAIIVVTFVIFRYLIYKAKKQSSPAGIKYNNVNNEQNETAGDFNIDEVKMPRTALGTLTEILIGAFLVTAWVMTAINGHFFEDDGSINIGYPFALLGGTIAIIIIIWDTYRPGKMREAGKLTNLKQVKLVVWQNRIGALMVAIVLLVTSFPSISKSMHPDWVFGGFLAVVAILFLTFRTLIRRAGDQQGH